MTELYVYYRLAPTDESRALHALQSAQQALRDALPGLEARLLRRGADPGSSPAPTAADAPSTWMETYRRDPGLSPDAVAVIRAALADLPPGRIGGRHEECFDALPATHDTLHVTAHGAAV